MGSLIPDAVIDEIRARVDVVAVIGRHMELKRSGRTWKGNCVFHGEKTPSFHVYPEDKHFKCYGCGAYGDVFKFLQRLEGKEFPEVVRALAQEVGVQIPEVEEDTAEQKARRKDRNEILAACDAAARYWAARLASRHGEHARAYLARRGVGEEAVQRFRLGVAADAWNDLPARVAEKGVGLAALRKAGLVVDREKADGTYDRFRNRLMFPIAAMDGQVIGFGGRALGEEKGAKYLNTPETALYKKSRVLYGLDLAREAVRRTRAAVLVEGYFDVIGLHQVGVQNAVAVCGTALTPEHVELLARCDCREVTILFDGDVAGLAAPAKAAEALFPAGLAGKVAILPSDAGKTDPDDYARAHGRAGIEALLAKAIPLSEFLLDRAVERTCRGPAREAALEQKLAAVRELEPHVRLMPPGLARTVFEDAIAKRLDLDVAALRAELSGERRRGAPPARPDPHAEPGPVQAPSRPPAGRPMGRAPAVRVVAPGPAVDALGILMAFPELGPIADEEGLPRLLPEGSLSDVARALVQGPLTVEEAFARLGPGLDAAARSRLQVLTGPGRHDRAVAERELRKASLKAKLARLDAELEEAGKRVVRAGTARADDLATEHQRLFNQKRDLLKRQRELERPG